MSRVGVLLMFDIQKGLRTKIEKTNMSRIIKRIFLDGKFIVSQV